MISGKHLTLYGFATNTFDLLQIHNKKMIQLNRVLYLLLFTVLGAYLLRFEQE